MRTIISAGGQAVIEGVLIRTVKKICIAVRTPSGRIALRKERIRSLLDRHRFFQLPLIRGIVTLVEMLIIGIRALSYSANVALEEKDEHMSWWELLLSLVLVFGFALVFFKYLPLLATEFLTGRSVLLRESALAFSIVEGILKLFLFVGYLALISVANDVQVLFRYHGAEHMAVHCYEHQQALTVGNVKKFPTMHPRCGTSFILFVFLVSIIVYAFIPNSLNLWQRYGYRVLLLPLIAGISYEILKLSAHYEHNALFRIVTKPGILLQHITTKKPDAKQIQVAIAAMKCALQ